MLLSFIQPFHFFHFAVRLISLLFTRFYVLGPSYFFLFSTFFLFFRCLELLEFYTNASIISFVL